MFYRVQHKGISFDEMAHHDSCTDLDEGVRGLAVSGSPDGLDGGSRFGGAWDAMDDTDEVIVLEGTIIEQIYDGYCIRPTREIARFTVGEWRQMIEDGTADNLKN